METVQQLSAALWALTAMLALGLIGAVLFLTVRAGSARWRDTGSRIEASIRAGAKLKARRVSFADLDRLPAPVQRYFRRALQDGAPFVEIACLKQAGELRVDEKRDAWMAFKAQHFVAPSAHSFVWDAQVAITPLVHARVRDAYVSGEGSGTVSLLSTFTLAGDRGGEELNSASLCRYLAEALWYPTALLPGTEVHWKALDDRAALASLTDCGRVVSLEFRFNDQNEVITVFAAGRYRRVGARFELTPWEARVKAYEARSGMWLPTMGEVGWYLSGQWHPVWRGRIVAAHYEFAG